MLGISKRICRWRCIRANIVWSTCHSPVILCVDIHSCNLVNYKLFTFWYMYCMQVFTTHHWMVRLYKLKPPKNRMRGKTKKSKSVCVDSSVSEIHATLDIWRQYFSCENWQKPTSTSSKRSATRKKNPWQ